jgi:hypothetical protein
MPFGVDHPQLARLGEALAWSGFAALLYWSPAMREFHLDPIDMTDIALAYDALLAHAGGDAARSRLVERCAGGAFALMGATDVLRPGSGQLRACVCPVRFHADPGARHCQRDSPTQRYS